VTITSVVDDIHTGANITCNTLVLAAGATATCTFTGPAPSISGNPGGSQGPLSETDTTTAYGADNDGNSTSASDTSIVTTPPRGKVIVSKTTSDGSSATGFKFEIRTGASINAVGTVLTSGLTDSSGSLTFQWLLPSLAPGGYQLCEANVMPGWTSSLRNFQNAFPLPQNGAFFVPNAIDPMVDNSFYCAPFTLVAGAELTFAIVNYPPPGGDGRTIGYWKNWASCTGGGQDPVLDEALASSTLTDEQGHHGVWIGKLFVYTCEQAVAILNKSTLGGKKMANDAAYELASQMLAAILNTLAGARNCTDLQTAFGSAQSLLYDINFNGTGDYLGPKVKGALLTKRSQALALAKQFDNYNNNKDGALCMP
jgi:hypothetical protein